jgi:hypothetical protein
MSDGSLQSDDRSLILHTQSFTKAKNELLSSELNTKFGFSSHVIPHKEIYWVISIPSKDAELLHGLIAEHLLPYFSYKVSKILF